MNKWVVAIVAMVSLSALAQNVGEDRDPDEFVLPGSGSLAVVTYAPAQESAIKSAVDSFAKTTLIDTKLVNGTGEFCFKKVSQISKGVSANAIIFVIDDNDMPIGVIAMIDRWAVVNVGALGKDNPRKEMLEKRVRCMIVRYAGELIGVLVPRTTNGIMVGAAKLTDLDAIKTEYLTYDLLANIKRYSEKSLIVPGRRMSYRRACERGIAPAPQTEYQKKVWNEFHSMPTKPIKIKYDKKLGK